MEKVGPTEIVLSEKVGPTGKVVEVKAASIDNALLETAALTENVPSGKVVAAENARVASVGVIMQTVALVPLVLVHILSLLIFLYLSQ